MARVLIRGNSSFFGNLFLTLLTLGFVEPDYEEVLIRKINGRDYYGAEAWVEPGEVELGLIFSGEEHRQSKGLLYLKFHALPGSVKHIDWWASGGKWTVQIPTGEKVLEVEGETFIPEAWKEGEKGFDVKDGALLKRSGQ